MLAVGAPAAGSLIVVFTLCGLATILFAWLSVRANLGIVLFVAATLVPAAAMKRAPGWERWAWPARGTG